MKPSSKAKEILFQVSAVVILLAAALFYFYPDVARYMMIFGAAGYGACTFTTPYPGKSVRGKRLFNIQILSVLFMAVSAYLMFVGRPEWVVTLIISAILLLYSTVAMSSVLKKEEDDK